LIEKTDNMQALRIMVDTDSGFGSLAMKYLEEIKDEFPKKTIVLYSVTGPSVNSEIYDDERKDLVTALKGYNLPFSVVGFNDLVNAYIPIDLNYSGQLSRNPDFITDFNADSLFHTSSVPALAINDLWSPLAEKKPYQNVDNILNPLVIFHRANILMNNIKMPFIRQNNFDGRIVNLFEDNKVDTCYKAKEFIHLSSPFWGPLHKAKPFNIQIDWSGAVHSKKSKNVVHQEARDFCAEKIGCHSINISEPRTLLPIPFPRYLSPKFDHAGDITPANTNEFVNNLSTLSTLYSTEDTGMIIEKVFLKSLKNMPYKHKIQFLKEDYMEEDDFMEVREKMQYIADAYMD
jgi:hypothetical protein